MIQEAKGSMDEESSSEDDDDDKDDEISNESTDVVAEGDSGDPISKAHMHKTRCKLTIHKESVDPAKAGTSKAGESSNIESNEYEQDSSDEEVMHSWTPSMSL